jgi:class 3 adenylate cyclase/tetratricopeptide (TPR) repeat protein
MNTQTVTVVFTDMVGANAHLAQLEPSVAEQVRRSHLSAMSDAISAHGGTEVKNVGDGVMAVFTSPSAAMACAVTMQQAVDRANRSGENPYSLRVGISAGETTLDEGDYFGDPVVEAARLCSAATGAQILVAALVRVMAGRLSHHQFSSMGDLGLKGLPDPVPTLQLDWQPEITELSVVPIPPRMVARSTLGFYGRRSERAVITRVLKRAMDGQPQIVLVGGEPGVGKTTLATVAAGDAHNAGSVVLYGRCDEDLGIPYQAFIEALSHYVEHAALEDLREHISEYGGELSRLVPALSERLPECPAPSSTDPDAERYLSFAAVGGLLTQAARDAPVMLVVDDLHWADRPTLQLLRYLAASAEPLRVLLLGTYRVSELRKGHPLNTLLAALRREDGATRMDLRGLSHDEVFELLSAAAGHELDETVREFVVALRRESGGNPFFIREMLRHLADSGGLVQDDLGQWSVAVDLEDLGLPETLVDIVSQRVGRLGPNAENALSMASVIGRDFDLDVLERVIGLPEDDLLDLIEQLQEAALIGEAELGVHRFTFTHALIQHTLYEGMNPDSRREAHRMVAEALEDRLGGVQRPAELAHHWSLADHPDKALQYAQLAAQAALDSIAPDEAIRWLDRALALQIAHCPGDTVLRCDLLISLGTAQRFAGDPAFRTTLLDVGRLAQSCGSAERMAAAALANYRGIWTSVGRVDEEKLAALEAALAHFPEGDDPVRAQMLAIRCSELTFRSPLAQRRVLAAEARSMATRLGDPATTVRVLNILFDPLRVPSCLGERLADTARVLQLAEGLGDVVELFTAVAYRMRAALEAGLIEESEQQFRRLGEMANELAHPYGRWIYTVSSASRALLFGDTDEAERLANEGLGYGNDSGQPDAVTFYLAGLHGVRFAQGRLAEVIPFFEQAASENPGIPAFWAALARGYALVGRTDDARRHLDRAVEHRFEHLPEDVLWLMALAVYGDVAMLLEDMRAAEMLYDLLAPWHGLYPYIGTAIESPVAHFLGGLACLLGRFEEAQSHFEEAEQMNTEASAKFSAARTSYEWGRMLLKRDGPGDRQRGLDMVHTAHSAATVYGYGAVARQAEAVLAAFSPVLGPL